MSALTIRYHRGGVHLPELGLWLDPHEPQLGDEKVFISHAHSDHIGTHREVILSSPTSRLMRARLSGEWKEHALPFGQTTLFGDGRVPFEITLLPAGHIFGSAMALIQTEAKSLLYTGDFKLRPGLSAESCEPRPAEILIMETTYGRKHYLFPPTDDVMKGIIRFCREALDNDETPVLLGYSLGKSQELLCGLSGAGFSILLHSQVFKLTEIYRELGQKFPAYEKYDGGPLREKVLLAPPSALNSPALQNLGAVRTAMLTGWAVDANARFRYRADATFPLSDHADFADLIEMVRKVNPKKIYTLHGFAADFAETLRGQGFDAEALSEEEQLALPFGSIPSIITREHEPRAQSIIPGPWPNEPALTTRTGERISEPPPARELANSFQGFAVVCSNVGSTSKKLEKVRLLAEYLRNLQAEFLATVSTWFTGHSFPQNQNKVLQLGWAAIRDALCTAYEMDQAEFGQVYLKHSDLGETAFEILREIAPPVSSLTIQDVAQLFEKLYLAKGPLGKLPLLIGALRHCTAIDGKYLIKILTGDLRIGLKEGLVEESIAAAFGVSLDEVKNASLLLGEIGETAQLAQRRQLASATLLPFRPVKYMLASPEETAAAIWERVAEWCSSGTRIEPKVHRSPTVWIEDKYDGIRCQLHKVGDRVTLYSRDLKEITPTFQELADASRSVPSDFVIDGEIVAMRGDQVRPFAELQRRLGRRESDLFLSNEIPVQFVAFDLLWFSGASQLNHPLRARREILEKLSHFRLSQITQAHSSDDIETAFTSARSRGNEGLVIKDPDSAYSPGRRGLAWLKLKKAYGTLDCIVVGAEYGHGKRKAVLSDYTFAVRDDKTGQLRTIGKSYIGLTDVEIARLTEHFLSKAIRQRGRYFDVDPDTVLEIAFDAIQPSARHSSGLAMRFPRILRIRADKSKGEIDTVASARRFVKVANS